MNEKMKKIKVGHQRKMRLDSRGQNPFYEKSVHPQASQKFRSRRIKCIFFEKVFQLFKTKAILMNFSQREEWNDQSRDRIEKRLKRVRWISLAVGKSDKYNLRHSAGREIYLFLSGDCIFTRIWTSENGCFQQYELNTRSESTSDFALWITFE